MRKDKLTQSIEKRFWEDPLITNKITYRDSLTLSIQLLSYFRNKRNLITVCFFKYYDIEFDIDKCFLQGNSSKPQAIIPA